MLRIDPLGPVTAPPDKAGLVARRADLQHGNYSSTHPPSGHPLDDCVGDPDSVAGSGRIIDQIPGEQLISCVIADDAPLRHLVLLVHDPNHGFLRISSAVCISAAMSQLASSLVSSTGCSTP